MKSISWQLATLYPEIAQVFTVDCRISLIENLNKLFRKVTGSYTSQLYQLPLKGAYLSTKIYILCNDYHKVQKPHRTCQIRYDPLLV